MSALSSTVAAGMTAGVAIGAAPSVHAGLLTAASLRPHACGTDTATRFVVVVPAHDEEVGLGSTLASLSGLDYPTASHDVVVLADNCTDATADIARQHGVRVMERFDADRRGKGQALHWAIPQLLADAAVDAIVIVDADTIVEADALQRVSWHLARGADAVQLDYRVRNPQMSWRTQLLDVAFTAQHRIRGAGRSALGLSSGLHGNGMAFSRATLAAVPYEAFSVVEDVEYAMMLGSAGRRVTACTSASVAGDMPDADADAAAQRSRWEAGAATVRRSHLRSLLAKTVRRGDPVAAGLATDLIAPPLASAVMSLGVATVATAVRPTRATVTLVGLGWVAVGAHVLRAAALSSDPRCAVDALIHVPKYLLWKLGLRRTDTWQSQFGGTGDWTRSNRSTAVTSLATVHEICPERLLESQGATR